MLIGNASRSLHARDKELQLHPVFIFRRLCAYSDTSIVPTPTTGKRNRAWEVTGTHVTGGSYHWDRLYILNGQKAPRDAWVRAGRPCHYSDFLMALLGNHFTGCALYAGQGGMVTWQESVRNLCMWRGDAPERGP